MRRICRTCRWWQTEDYTMDRKCNNVDSDMRFDETDEEYSCSHWMPEIEQDGDATWYLEGIEAIPCRSK